MAAQYAGFGLNASYAKVLASVEGNEAARRTEEAFFNAKDITKFIGKHTLAEFIETNKALYVGAK